MNRWLKPVMVLAVTGSLAGCASSHPLGISATEWESLSFEQRVEANQRQVAIDAAGRYQRDERRREEARRKIASSAEPEFAHLRYAHTDYFHRDNSQADCVIQGEVKSTYSWQRAYPVHFVVRVGNPKTITIESWDGSFVRSGVVAFDSIGVQLCESRQDMGSASNRCMEAELSSKWLDGGEIMSGEAEDLFRGTAQCHIYQKVWRPNQHYSAF